METDFTEPDFMEPPVLMRINAIGNGAEMTANQREDLRIEQETIARDARNMDNMMTDYEAANSNRGGRKSKRHRISRRHRKSKRHRNKRTRKHKKRRY